MLGCEGCINKKICKFIEMAYKIEEEIRTIDDMFKDTEDYPFETELSCSQFKELRI